MNNAWFAAAGALALGAVLLQGSESSYALIPALLAALAACGGLIARNPRQGAMATALVCFGANAYLFDHKFRAEGESSLCNIDTVFNCDVVNSSEWSMAFGLPITLFGMAFYLGLAFAALSSVAKSPRFAQVNGLFAIPTLLVSVVLAVISKQIGAFCVMCITIYLGNGLLLWSALAELKATGRALFDDVGSAVSSNTFVTISGVFAIVSVIGATEWQEKVDEGHRLPTSAADWSSEFVAADAPIALNGTEPALGPDDAAYTIVEFADFGCPHCAAASREAKPFIAENPDVRLLFKPFPLTSECNDAMMGGGSVERCAAAAAAECANRDGRFWDMSGLLFANQGYFSRDDLLYMAREAGFDEARFGACLDDPTVMDAIRAHAAAGAAAGVPGTPTFFLRGTHGDQWIRVERGLLSAQKVIEAHRAGTVLPAPTPAPPLR